MTFVHCWRCRVEVSPSGRRIMAYPEVRVTTEQVQRVCETMRVIRESRGELTIRRAP